jgi:hypothetical protein
MAVLVAGAVVLAATVADRGGVMQVAAAGALVVVPVALDRIDRIRLPGSCLDGQLVTRG